MAVAGTCSGRLLVSVTFSELATLLYTVVGQPREQLTVATGAGFRTDLVHSSRASVTGI